MSAKRWLPHPWLSLFLVVVWQLIMNDLSAGTLIMGFVLALGIPLADGRLLAAAADITATRLCCCSPSGCSGTSWWPTWMSPN
ncbi:hypothetical protein ULF88_17125 [Halopseudomonas pachastrellae]|nr:hypothetical protein [Halopseudomonas pachastrellae]